MRTALVAIGIAAASPAAHADDSTQYLNVGMIFSASAGTHSMAGLGVEATYTSFSGELGSDGWGMYVQAETGGKPFDTASHLLDDKRYAAGFLFIHDFYGVEAGGLYRTAPDVAGTAGLQLGAFITAGVLSIEARAGIAPAGTADNRQYGSDIGIVIATKVPMQVGGKAFAIKNVQLLPCIWRCKPPKT